MARKNTTETAADTKDGTPVTVLSEALQDELDEANDIEGGELFSVTDEIRNTEGVRLQIVRTYPNTPELAGHVGDMTVGEFSIEAMRERFGPGKYRVRVKGPRGFLPGGGSVSIAKPNLPPGAAPAGGPGNLQGFLDALTARDREREAREERERERRQERRDRMMELIIPAAVAAVPAVLGALKGGGDNTAALITALRPAPGPSMADMVTTLQGLQSLGAPKEDSTDKLLKLLEVAKEFTGEGGKGETNWLDLVQSLIKDGAPVVKSAFESMAAAPRIAVVPQSPVGAAPALGAAGVAPQPTLSGPSDVGQVLRESGDKARIAEGPPAEDQVNFVMQRIFRDWMKKLIAWAKSDKRPDLYAEVFLDEIPEWMLKQATPEQVLGYLEHPQWWEIVTQFAPDAAPFKVWADQFRAELVSLVKEQMREGE